MSSWLPTRAQTIEQMPDAEQGMLPKHFRASTAHHRFDLFAAIPLVTVHRTLGTGRFFLAEATAIQTQVHVVHQPLTFLAQAATVLAVAVNMHHRRDGPPLARQSGIGKFRPPCGLGCRRCCLHGFTFSLAWKTSTCQIRCCIRYLIFPIELTINRRGNHAHMARGGREADPLSAAHASSFIAAWAICF